MSAPLEQLHDFYQPPPPSWHPQTAGSYVSLSIMVVLLVALIAFFWHRWTRNRYRREALRELPHTDVHHISELLKRTALSAWPRTDVASLTGPAWLAFLNSSAKQTLFDTADAKQLETMAFSDAEPSCENESALRSAASVWIKHHAAMRKEEKHVQA
ncbi:DUF4381 domain-containing protein [Terriglobus roseus]|uniref:DUF4381 domain-containing protein n=1 Tax=Terriglobus roseus TaxID=392734 RepID=A0A1G7L2R6_9BACT|nr:DUF4381 domain-containing protein [Terriglobus roseus]SDF43743.1 protein of unknown function [Terriglobus roseus]